jgi:photosystem II stability/assembly factor-like uncharacterized protein
LFIWKMLYICNQFVKKFNPFSKKTLSMKKTTEISISKKLVLMILSFVAFTSFVQAQNCVYFVDTIPQNISCGDSVRLSANIFKKTNLVSGSVGYLRSLLFTDVNTGYLASDDGLFKTFNAGANWSQLSTGTISGFNSIFFIDSDTGYAVGGYGDIIKTTDAGTTWVSLVSNTTNLLMSIYFVNDTIGFASGANGRIVKTSNAGATWTVLTSGTTSTLNSIYFTDVNTGYAVGQNGVIVKTVNSGDTWTELSSGTTSTINSVVFTDANTGFFVCDYGIFKTQNAGMSWEQKSTVGYFVSIQFKDANNGYGFFGNGMVLKTTDAGNTWGNSFNGINDFITAACFVDDNTYYFASNYGVLRKITLDPDATYNWTPSSGINNPNSMNPYVKPNSEATYKVTITPSAGFGCNAYTDSLKVVFAPQIAPEICMVSIKNEKNLVMWDKPVTTLIDSFYIWRETDVTNVYEKIGAISYADSSLFVDNNSNSLIQSNKYRISLKDECGMESDKSSVAHKTMHLSINQGVGSVWNLIWEPYQGFNVNTYKIYRGTNKNDLTLIGTTSGTSTQYSDLTAPTGNVYYQVQVVNPNQCNPSKSLNISASNIATNDVTYGVSDNKTTYSFIVYPNPVTNELRIELKDNNKMRNFEILNALGQVIYKGCLTDKAIVSTSNFPSGVYLVKIENGNTFEYKKIIKE